MDTQAFFGLSILMSFAAFGLVTRLYVWPRLQRLERDDAILALVVPHAFRFIGLAFLVPGVVAATLPSGFAVPTAIGDLITALLAIDTHHLPSRWCGCSTCGVSRTCCLPTTTAYSAFRFSRACSERPTTFRLPSCRRFSSRTASYSGCFLHRTGRRLRLSWLRTHRGTRRLRPPDARRRRCR